MVIKRLTSIEKNFFFFSFILKLSSVSYCTIISTSTENTSFSYNVQLKKLPKYRSTSWTRRNKRVLEPLVYTHRIPKQKHVVFFSFWWRGKGGRTIRRHGSICSAQGNDGWNRRWKVYVRWWSRSVGELINTVPDVLKVPSCTNVNTARFLIFFFFDFSVRR